MLAASAATYPGSSCANATLLLDAASGFPISVESLLIPNTASCELTLGPSPVQRIVIRIFVPEVGVIVAFKPVRFVIVFADMV